MVPRLTLGRLVGPTYERCAEQRRRGPQRNPIGSPAEGAALGRALRNCPDRKLDVVESGAPEECASCAVDGTNSTQIAMASEPGEPGERVAVVSCGGPLRRPGPGRGGAAKRYCLRAVPTPRRPSGHPDRADRRRRRTRRWRRRLRVWRERKPPACDVWAPPG